MQKNQTIALIVVALFAVAGIGTVMILSDDDEPEKKGFYKWNPSVVKVNGSYSNCTPAFMTIAETVFEEVYGDVPSFEGIKRTDIPENYLYNYNPYVTENADGTLTVKTFDNTSTGLTEAFADKTIDFKPTKVIAYTNAVIDTIYRVLCDKNGETPLSGNTAVSEGELWNLVPAMTASVKSGVESDFGLAVPSSVTIIGGGQEDLVAYCSSMSSDDKVIIFMSEYNIRSTNSSSWWNNIQNIQDNSGGNIQFIFTLANSPAMVLSTIDMIGKVIGADNSEAMMTKILAEIYVMQKAIDEKYSVKTFYAETASVKSVGSNTLMGGIISSILKLDNVFDGSLMGSKMSDEDIIVAQPQVLVFYTSDTRSMDELMRAA